MNTLFKAQNIRRLKHATIFSFFAVALTACGGGGGSAASTSIEDQVIALHAKIDAQSITEDSFISQIAGLIG